MPVPQRCGTACGAVCAMLGAKYIAEAVFAPSDEREVEAKRAFFPVYACSQAFR